MPSKVNTYSEAFVWIWLPGETKPVVVGKLTAEGPNLIFNYGKSYLERPNGIAISNRELPLQSGVLPLLDGLSIPGCIRDGSPDAWGRRVLINRKFSVIGSAIDEFQLDELTYLLESGSDRIGALDFQLSPTHYEPRSASNVTLEELLASAERVEKGVALTPELDMALHYGSPIGGARPKALIEDGNKKYIAKFASTSDVYSIIKAEFVTMRLAKLAGLDVAPVSLKKAAHKDVLLIERFDRVHMKNGWQRRSMLSALTLFELDEMMARYASYEKFAEIIRYSFKDASLTLKELFQRLTFNVLVGNTDDHARNHAAFWDGQMLSLTPAYDICPQARSGNVATQAMLIMGNENRSQIASCLNAAGNFLLSRQQAMDIIENQIKKITVNWNSVCDLAEVNPIDRKLFANRQFLNPYAFENLSKDAEHLLEPVRIFKMKI
ncbi:HipA domain-containing protein [Bdellovibrionota bacterium FG-2]